jgi:hypothetical protein
MKDNYSGYDDCLYKNNLLCHDGSIINSRLLFWLCLEVGKQRITEI